MRARVIVLAGPSGAGKSRLAERLGLPVLRLDDYYKNGGDPTLPVISHGANAGLTDWDHPDSWLPDDAMAAIAALCREGRAEVPIYDIAHDGRTGSRTLDLGGSRLFVAEGLFAQDVVPAVRRRRPARRGVLRPAAPRRHVLAAADPRPARASQAAAGAGPPRLGADARPAPGGRRRRGQGMPAGHAGRGVRRHPPTRGARARRWLTTWCRPGPLPSSGGGWPSPTRPRAGRPAWSWRTSSSTRSTPTARPSRRPSARRCSTLHHRVTSPRDSRGRLQLPWPSMFGTPPWAAARQMAAITEASYGQKLARTRRERAFDRIVAATGSGRPAPVFVGSKWLPRHVVLALGRRRRVTALLRARPRPPGRRLPRRLREGQAGPGRVGPSVVHRGAGLTHPDPLRRGPWPSASRTRRR